MPQNRINLLPDEAKVKISTNPFLTWFSNMGIYLVLIVYVVATIGLIYRFSQEQMLKSLNSSIETKVGEIQRSQSTIGDFLALQTKYQVLGTMLKDFIPTSSYIDIVKSTIPTPITLDSLRMESGVMTIDGSTTEYGAITQWYNTLKTDDTFKSVDLGSISRDPTDEESLGKVLFTLTLTY